MTTYNEIVETYTERTPRSRAEYERAQQWIPGGVGSAIQFQAPHPLYVERSQGARVWDLDGNEYIDYNLCFGAMVAGHANPIIKEAIQRQADAGTLFGMPTALACEFAAELQRRYPVMESMRFTNSGVEATSYAIRVARAATRKDKFIKAEGAYHGAMDELLVSNNPHRMEAAGPAWDPTPVVETEGARSDAAEHSVVIPFNDLEALERKLSLHKDDTACVILVPVLTNGGVIAPLDGYLQGVRDLTRQYNVLFILDEVKTGCRLAPGGAVELYGVEPDLVTLAKAIGGGTSLGAFGGRADLMDLVSPVGQAAHYGTYNANPLVMAAGLACLRDVLTGDVYEHLDRLGDLLAQGQRDLIAKFGLPASVTQVGPIGGILFAPDVPTNYREARRCDLETWSRYWYGMLNRGVIPMGCAWFEEWSISVAHTENDIERTLAANDETLADIVGN